MSNDLKAATVMILLYMHNFDVTSKEQILQRVCISVLMIQHMSITNTHDNNNNNNNNTPTTTTATTRLQQQQQQQQHVVATGCMLSLQ
jgi:hypothetical protein